MIYNKGPFLQDLNCECDCAEWCRVLNPQIFKSHLWIFLIYFTERLVYFYFCYIAPITFAVAHHSLICGHWAAPMEQLGLRAPLKGTTVVLTRERQVLLFSSLSPRIESVTFWSKTHFSREQLPQLRLFRYKCDIRHYIALCFTLLALAPHCLPSCNDLGNLIRHFWFRFPNPMLYVNTWKRLFSGLII